MKVLLVSEHFPPGFRGGSATYLASLARGLARRGHDVGVVAGGAAGVEHEEGVSIHRTGVDPAGTGPRTRVAQVLATRSAVRRLIPSLAPDLLHLNHAYPSLGALLGSRGRRLPCVATFYAPYHLEWRAFEHVRPDGKRNRASRAAARLGYGRLVEGIERAVFRRARRVLALSESSREQAVESLGVDPGRIDLVPGGVDGTRFRPAGDRSEVRRRLGIGADRLVLLTVRRLDPRMGLEDLVRAAALLRRLSPLLLVVGSGRLEGRLREVAREEGIEGEVRFPGSVPDGALPDYYRAADLFVLPSRGLEAFGLVTLEALASGLPVVGTDVGGTGEILRPLDPRLVSGTGPEALAAAIERAHREGLCAPAFAERCRAYALDRFPWERAVEALERSYRAALEGRG